jgi:hypothetical protein
VVVIAGYNVSGVVSDDTFHSVSSMVVFEYKLVMVVFGRYLGVEAVMAVMVEDNRPFCNLDNFDCDKGFCRCFDHSACV